MFESSFKLLSKELHDNDLWENRVSLKRDPRKVFAELWRWLLCPRIWMNNMRIMPNATPRGHWNDVDPQTTAKKMLLLSYRRPRAQVERKLLEGLDCTLSFLVPIIATIACSVSYETRAAVYMIYALIWWRGSTLLVLWIFLGDSGRSIATQWARKLFCDNNMQQPSVHSAPLRSQVFLRSHRVCPNRKRTPLQSMGLGSLFFFNAMSWMFGASVNFPNPLTPKRSRWEGFARRAWLSLLIRKRFFMKLVGAIFSKGVWSEQRGEGEDGGRIGFSSRRRLWGHSRFRNQSKTGQISNIDHGFCSESVAFVWVFDVFVDSKMNDKNVNRNCWMLHVWLRLEDVEVDYFCNGWMLLWICQWLDVATNHYNLYCTIGRSTAFPGEAVADCRGSTLVRAPLKLVWFLLWVKWRKSTPSVWIKQETLWNLDKQDLWMVGFFWTSCGWLDSFGPMHAIPSFECPASSKQVGFSYLIAVWWGVLDRESRTNWRWRWSAPLVQLARLIRLAVKDLGDASQNQEPNTTLVFVWQMGWNNETISLSAKILLDINAGVCFICLLWVGESNELLQLVRLWLALAFSRRRVLKGSEHAHAGPEGWWET